MNQENEVLANFQVEELEKRFEMGWRNKHGRIDYGQHHIEEMVKQLIGDQL